MLLLQVTAKELLMYSATVMLSWSAHLTHPHACSELRLVDFIEHDCRCSLIIVTVFALGAFYHY